MSESLIVSLNSQVDSLEIVGGKGRSLAKLTNAGFDVPGGFQVTTDAYRQFVAEHDLQSRILEQLAATNKTRLYLVGDPASLFGPRVQRTASRSFDADDEARIVDRDSADVFCDSVWRLPKLCVAVYATFGRPSGRSISCLDASLR
jgi:hypothetical protein